MVVDAATIATAVCRKHQLHLHNLVDQTGLADTARNGGPTSRAGGCDDRLITSSTFKQ